MPVETPSTTRLRAEHALAFAFFSALSLAYLRPIWRLFASHLAPDLGDPLFNLVLLKWGARKLSTGFAGFWDAPFFFPATGVTAFSDHLLGPAGVAALLGRFGVPPVAAYNLLFLGSFVLSGWTTYWVLRRMGRSGIAAVLGGMAFAFAPFRWDQGSHLQVLLAQWIPLVLWHFDRLLEEATWRRAGLFLFFYALHVTGGTYLAYMIHLPLLALLVNRRATLLERWNRARALVLGATAAAALLLLGSVFAPYWRAAGQGHERREFEVRQFGASLASLATPSASNLYASRFRPQWRRQENALFPGFLPAALAAVALVAGFRRLRRKPEPPIARTKRRWLSLLSALALLAFLLAELRTWLYTPAVRASGVGWSTPPYVTTGAIFALALIGWAVLYRRAAGGWPLALAELSPWERGLLSSGALAALLAFPIVFVPAMRFVPGLSGMRVASRFFVFVSFALAALAARGFELVRDRLASAGARRAWAAAAIALLALELAPFPLTWNPVLAEDRFPPVYRFLAQAPDVRAILELPIGEPLDDLPYLYFGTLHGKPMVNGYSGFVPPENASFRADCCHPVPDPEQLARLAAWGVTHVVVHLDRYPQKWQRRMIRSWPGTAPVLRVYRDRETQVFALAERR